MLTPLRDSLRRHSAKHRRCDGAPQKVDQLPGRGRRGSSLLHERSVSALTYGMQVCLNEARDITAMLREPTSPSERVRWAIDQSGRKLEDIAAAIDCTHSALSQWQTGKTNLYNVKVGLLLAFCRETGANIQWLLTGDGPRLVSFARSPEEPPLVTQARHIVQDLTPDVAATAYRLLAALEPEAAASR